ncbi:uncharacterized protein LOC142614945 [Castanea sativa]|uniref:uncharacterized protein LOC142614945 n=1 Tax=Castanea sativa TaxID=21020 RepID=UPI003F650611
MASTENSTNPTTTNSSSSAGQASAGMEDPSLNPFFLSSSDVLGSQLVSQPKTGAKNYQSWSRAMIVSLTAKNKIGFLNGTIAIPDASSIEYISWTKCNMTIFSLIINSISREIASSLMYTNNVSEVLLNLQDRFSQGNMLQGFLSFKGNYHLSQKASSQLRLTSSRLLEQLINFQAVPDTVNDRVSSFSMSYYTSSV